MKFFKKFAAIFAAIVATVCIAAFATACDDDKVEYATTEFTVTFKYEDGTAFDGSKHKSGESWMNDAVQTIPAPHAQIQFCAVLPSGELGICANPIDIGEDGKVVVPLAAIKAAAESQNTNMVELHICNISSYGYTKGEDNSAYGRYEVDKIPVSLTITLKLASEVA